MGETTAIGWTDHTFNPWWGCERVSPACQHCYAETFAKRTGNAVWGKNADRRFFGDKHWAEPLKWDRQAAEDGRRHLVFCASMADVFEDRPDLDEHRARLFALIEATPHLTWQLLTKRPNVANRVFIEKGWTVGEWPDVEWQGPSNIWIGTTVEDQQRAEERIPYLLSIPAPIRFLSCEPLLGPVDLLNVAIFRDERKFGFNVDMNVLMGYAKGVDDVWPFSVDWVICGGESGPGHRPLNIDLAISLRDQCSGRIADAFGLYGDTPWRNRVPVPFFFKQVGGRTPTAGGDLLDGVRHKAFPVALSGDPK